MIAAAELLGGDDRYDRFLRYGVRFASEFEVWGGFKSQ